MPTDRTFTGQISEPDLGLSFYTARWYDSYLNRFLSPDTIVPDPYNPQDWDRYSYARNNPITFNDPTGHDVGCSAADPKCHAQNAIPSLPPKKPEIVSRQTWGAASPGSRKNTEGLYDSVNNASGYAEYADLLPNKTLGEVLDTVVFHHEGNFQTYDVAQVQENEMNRGAYDIAYHYVIGPDGTIYEGRDIGVRGAHVESANTGKIGILWLGDFEPGMAFDNGLHVPFDFNGNDPRPTEAQIQASIDLVGWLDYEYGIDSAYGHQAINADTACPGANANPFISILSALVQEIR